MGQPPLAPTCQSSDIAAESRIDYILVDEHMLPRITDSKVGMHDQIATHAQLSMSIPCEAACELVLEHN